MSTTSIPSVTAAARSLLLGALLLAACGPPGVVDDPDAGSVDGPRCEWDDSEGADSSVSIASGETVTGWLCPVEDEDWYEFETGPSDHLVSVSLAIDGPLSPVEPTYLIRRQEADGSPGPVTATPPPEEVGGPLDLVHCMAPGRYYVVVRDQNDDAQDIRRGYTLVVGSSPDPDPAEPNDDAAAAITTAGGASTGTIACRGDEDWHAVDVPAGRVLRLHLESPIAKYQPTLSLRAADGAVRMSESNPAGALRATAIERLASVSEPGRWYVVVSDDDGRNADPAIPYTLTIELIQDQDPNEPNDQPEDATALDAMACGGAWATQSRSGSFSAPGDQDWFRVPISGCGSGVIEAEVELDQGGLSAEAAWALQQELQASVGIVVPHQGSPCTSHEGCQRLALPCNTGWDCAGLSNACLPEGLCSGASACLAEGVCGAVRIQRQYRSATPPSPVTGAPPPNRAVASAPLTGGDYVYLRVSDYQGNAGDPSVPYTLRVRLRADPDVYEPSNVYTPFLTDLDEKRVHASKATTVPVHDCTMADCCDGASWVQGAISYELDNDWFRYQHPCPGEDCLLRIHYQVAAGPVDLIFKVLRGTSDWFDLIRSQERESQPALDEVFGPDQVGTPGTGECLYAYQSHTGNPYWYHLWLRDLMTHTNDWSADQTYRFCVEKVANACFEPCALHPNDGTCTTP